MMNSLGNYQHKALLVESWVDKGSVRSLSKLEG